MGIQTIKVLRTISKIVLLVFVLGLLGWGGYYVYRSIAFKPQNIAVTNITDSSATITWTTSSQMNGVVYYKKDSSVLPGPLGIIGSHIGYDDRDVSDAQTACVDKFNKNAGETKDENFSVSGENFDCENARVTGMGKYYTHSVTIKDLDPESTYYFAMGDGIWSFKSDVSSVKTFALLEEVKEPSPVFGRVVGDDGSYSRDALIYITFNDGSEGKSSVLYSSTTNDDGGWYLDASGVRYQDGEILPLELTNDSFDVYGVYSNYGKSDTVKYILGYFNGSYPDVVVEKNVPVSMGILDRLVIGVYAGGMSQTRSEIEAACPKCVALTDKEIMTLTTGGSLDRERAKYIGYGNVAKAIAATNGGNFTMNNLTQMGLSSNTGNMNALVSTGVATFRDTGEESNYVINYDGGSVASTSYCSGDEYCSSGCSHVNGKCGYIGSPVDVDGDPTMCGEIQSGACSSRKTCVNGTLEYVVGSCGYTGGDNDPGVTDPDSDVVCTAAGASCSDSSGDGVCVTNTGAGTLECDHFEGDPCKENNLEGTLDDEGVCIVSTDTTPLSEIKYTINLDNVSDPRFGANGGVDYTVKTAVGRVILTNAQYEALESGTSFVVSVTEADIKKLVLNDPEAAREFADEYPSFREEIEDRIEKLDERGGSGNGFTADIYSAYCQVLGGEQEPYRQCVYDSNNGNSTNNILGIFNPSKVSAYTTDENIYVLYLPEYGLYSMQLGNYTMGTTVSDGNTMYIFYLEINGVDGFQAPEDPDNPTSEEDIVLGSDAYEVTYEQQSTAQQYNMEQGINILSFNFVPVSNNSGAYTAEDLIDQASDNGVEIEYVATFEGGRWYTGYSCSSDTCTGTNFSIVPGRGYLVKASNSGTITIPGYNLKSSIPVAFSSGWNLVGIHGYTTAYTARTLIDSINKIDGLTANNVSWWPTSKGKYEGLQVENSTEYGLDFAISPTNGYFVRVSEFAPSDTKCKSILWNDGGTLNGTCGNTK